MRLKDQESNSQRQLNKNFGKPWNANEIEQKQVNLKDLPSLLTQNWCKCDNSVRE